MGQSKDILIDQKHHQLLIEFSPVIAFTCLTGVLGVFGNVLTFFFFKGLQNKSSTVIFIIALSVVDLIVCIVSFTSVLELVDNIKYADRYLCKIMYFLDKWTVITSVLILWVISVDRYLKICRESGTQISVKSAKICVLFCVIFAICLSLGAFTTIDLVPLNITTSDVVNTAPNTSDSSNTTNAVGHYCMGTNDADRRSFVIVSYVFDIIAFFVVLLTFIFTYGRVFQRLRIHRLSLKKHSKDLKKGNINEQESSKKESSKTTDHFSTEVASSSNKVFRSEAKSDLKQNVEKSVSGRTKCKENERKLAVMMCVVSLGFVVCFIPHLIITIAIRIPNPGHQELDWFIQLVLRFPFFEQCHQSCHILCVQSKIQTIYERRSVQMLY